MSEDTPLTVHQVVIHQVEHHESTEPKCSDFVATPTPYVTTFLSNQIRVSRRHKRLRSAWFKSLDGVPNLMEELCDEMLGEPHTFLKCSQELARRLFDSMKGNRRISKSDLVVLSYSEPGDHQIWLGLLKIKHEPGVTSRVIEEGGSVRIEFDQIDQVVTNNDLQKCALIIPRNLRRDRNHVYILDQQESRQGSRRFSANFFVDKFMQMDIDQDSLKKTDIVYWATKNWVSDQAGLSPDQQKEVETIVAEALKQPEIDVESLAAHLPLEEGKQRRFVEHINQAFQAEGFTGLTFHPDRSHNASYRYFEGDNGLHIRVKANEFGEGQTFFYTERTEDEEFVNLSIRTRRLVEKKR